MDFFFFLICCSVDFLQQILPQENSSGRRLSILVSTSNKKVVQSLNYLLKLFTVLLPPAVASLPVLTLHCLLQQPEPTPEPQRDERDMGELSSPLCRATEGTGMAPVPQHSPPGSLSCRRSCRNTDPSCSLALALHISLQLIAAAEERQEGRCFSSH